LPRRGYPACSNEYLSNICKSRFENKNQKRASLSGQISGISILLSNWLSCRGKKTLKAFIYSIIET
jgi:hypothetical protein